MSIINFINKIFILLLLFVTNNVLGQITERTINNGGGQTSNPNIYIDFSIGEPLINEYIGNIYVTEGVIQPINITPSSTANVNFNLNLFPNPTHNELFLLLDNASDFTYQVIDVHGRVYPTSIDEKSIDVSNLASGIYLLITSYKKSNKVFQNKFIKI